MLNALHLSPKIKKKVCYQRLRTILNVNLIIKRSVLAKTHIATL